MSNVESSRLHVFMVSDQITFTTAASGTGWAGGAPARARGPLGRGGERGKHEPNFGGTLVPSQIF